MIDSWLLRVIYTYCVVCITYTIYLVNISFYMVHSLGFQPLISSFLFFWVNNTRSHCVSLFSVIECPFILVTTATRTAFLRFKVHIITIDHHTSFAASVHFCTRPYVWPLSRAYISHAHLRLFFSFFSFRHSIQLYNI